LPFNSGKRHEGDLLTDRVMSGVQEGDSNLGFRTELENLTGDDKGKSTSGSPTRLDRLP